MNMSRRAARMQRTHKRNKQGGGLNLTALMDIFTILVFFLMVNQSEVTVQSSDDIKLPASLADTQPEEQVTILLTKTSILVRGNEIVSTAEALAEEGEEITALKKELEYLASRTPVAEGAVDEGRAITIMGDKDIAYNLLKKVMNTSAKASFNQISLAVDQVQPGGGG